jgi:hypothetical protein
MKKGLEMDFDVFKESCVEFKATLKVFFFFGFMNVLGMQNSCNDCKRISLSRFALRI